MLLFGRAWPRVGKAGKDTDKKDCVGNNTVLAGFEQNPVPVKLYGRRPASALPFHSDLGDNNVNHHVSAYGACAACGTLGLA